MMYSQETIDLARKECKCCPDCCDSPCEGSLNWDCDCDGQPCTCEEDDCFDDESWIHDPDMGSQ